jgi:hypothetical protein
MALDGGQTNHTAHEQGVKLIAMVAGARLIQCIVCGKKHPARIMLSSVSNREGMSVNRYACPCGTAWTQIIPYLG